MARPRTAHAPDPFITREFLLGNAAGRQLYHCHAAELPIIDYHNHLAPADIASDRRFANLTRLWLAEDHYKWRAMRANGIDERLVTGPADDRERFLAWAATVPKCLRNPLYHWTHLELSMVFGIDRLLGPDTAAGIWDECNARLAEPAFSARGLLARFRVQVVCTTDDPADRLEHHIAIAGDRSCRVQVRPTWRPDRAMGIDAPERFNAWVDALAAAADVHIGDFNGFLAALRARHDEFHRRGCRVSDHGLEHFPALAGSAAQAAQAFATARAGGALGVDDVERFRAFMLDEGARMDHARGWVQQFHLGPLRNTNSRLLRRVGADAGCDSIGDASFAVPLARFLDRLDSENRLAKTILYNLHPKDYPVLGTMIGNFQDGVTPGKIQLGAAWWFLDQKDGINAQLDAISNFGLLSRFVGMLTDSRSLLSQARHDYFRRVLCDRLGAEIERGELPADEALVGGLVADVCYRNAARYFDFGLNA